MFVSHVIFVNNCEIFVNREVFVNICEIFVKLGSYGLPQPWYFPLSKSYWQGHNAKGDWCGKYLQAEPLSVMEEDQACAQYVAQIG